MNITNIIFRKTFDSGKLKAIASITLDGCFAIHEIKVIETDHLFVAMPSRREEHGVYRDIIHPISTNARSALENSIIEAYRQYIS